MSLFLLPCCLYLEKARERGLLSVGCLPRLVLLQPLDGTAVTLLSLVLAGACGEFLVRRGLQPFSIQERSECVKKGKKVVCVCVDDGVEVSPGYDGARP